MKGILSTVQPAGEFTLEETKLATQSGKDTKVCPNPKSASMKQGHYEKRMKGSLLTKNIANGDLEVIKVAI